MNKKNAPHAHRGMASMAARNGNMGTKFGRLRMRRASGYFRNGISRSLPTGRSDFRREGGARGNSGTGVDEVNRGQTALTRRRRAVESELSDETYF